MQTTQNEETSNGESKGSKKTVKEIRWGTYQWYPIREKRIGCPERTGEITLRGEGIRRKKVGW